MNRTNIEWIVNPDGSCPGWSWNPITGCLNHTNGLCKGGGFPCYAYRLAHGRLKQRYLANNEIAPIAVYHSKLAIDDGWEEQKLIQKVLTDPFYPRFWEGRLYWDFAKLQNAKPRGIFVCDMGELFGGWIPAKWTEAVLYSISKLPQHRFYLLTKQPQNLTKFSPFPQNCWVGVTVTSNGAMTLALTHLAYVEAKVKFFSFEPLLGSIGMSDHMSIKGIADWVIIGAQTKPYKPPRWEWVSEVIDACVDAGIPYFLKDNLEKIVPRVSGGFILGKLRQEPPDGEGEG